MSGDIEPRPQNRELTEMQRAFVDAKLNGAGIREAAEIAGYATPERTGYLVLRQASVKRAIEDATRSKLRHDMGPRALETLDSIASDPAQNGRVRGSDAKALSAISRMNLAQENEAGTRKDLSEQTATHITQPTSNHETHMATKARAITHITPQK